MSIEQVCNQAGGSSAEGGGGGGGGGYSLIMLSLITDNCICC